MANETTETETGRYSCPVCPKRFTELSVKKAHVRKHGPKPKAKR